MLAIDSLFKTYPGGVQALKGISLEIGTGMFGLLGSNGAGKSTLMRILATLSTPDSGSVRMDRSNILRDVLAHRKMLGYLPQEFGTYPENSIYEMMDHIGRLKGIGPAGERKDQIDALLNKFNLATHRSKRLAALSGGMKQRFGIAQALLGNPKLIIVDEPTAGLDPGERNRFHNLLSEIGRDTTVILSTHIVEDVAKLCPDMAILHRGEIILKGKTRQLIRTLEGAIWQKSASREELYDLFGSRQVLSTTLFEGRHRVTVYSERDPGDGFQPRDPTLEDLYFHSLGSNNGPGAAAT